MNFRLCHSATARRVVKYITLLVGLVWVASAQTANWRKVGTSAVELMLASPATGPVVSVWYSVDGRTLYARTRSGRVFETSDYEIWTSSSVTSEGSMEVEGNPRPVLVAETIGLTYD